MVNRGEKWLKACYSVFLLEEDKMDCLEYLKLNLLFVLKCFDAIKVNICMVKCWFTVVYREVIHKKYTRL